MIIGVVHGDEARILLNVQGPGGQEQEVDAVIDTGYTASLALPPAVVAALDLRWRSVDRAILADGTECLIDVYDAEVEWDGTMRPILVDEADAAPLVGMALLNGYELNVQVRSGGKVRIERLP